MIQSHCPSWINFIALSRQFAFVWIIYGHPSHRIVVLRIPVLCFHLLVFVDVQAALCSSSVLCVNIHLDMHNMQNMLHIQFLLLTPDIADKCYSHSTWHTNFNRCQRTIFQHRVNAGMGLCACRSFWHHDFSDNGRELFSI